METDKFEKKIDEIMEGRFWSEKNTGYNKWIVGWFQKSFRERGGKNH